MKLREKLSYLGVVLPTLTSMFAPVSVDSTEQSEFDIVGGLNARMYRAWPDGSRLLSNWAALSSTLPGATAFTTAAWQAAIARPFNRVGRSRLCAVNSGDYTCAVLPLVVGENDLLETPGAMISDNLEPLVDPDFREPAWRSMLRLLRTQRNSGQSIVLHNLPTAGAAHASLLEFASDEGFDLHDETCAQSGRIALRGTWDDYLATLDGRDRKELRRKLKNATTKAGARMTITTSANDLPEALERVFNFMRCAGGAKGIKARWTYRPLFRRITEALAASRQLEVHTLWLNERPAAGLIAFPTADGPMLWAAGFDPELAKLSPGIVLFAMSIQHAIDTGAKGFDLLRGQMRYKCELGVSEYELKRVTLTRR